MKPTRFQHLLADNRPLTCILAASAFATVIWVGSVLFPTISFAFWSIVEFIALELVAACLGIMLGVIVSGFVLPILLFWIERRNGAPFQVGDEVVILSDRLCGHTTRVYEIWPSRHEVRVELGDAERRAVTDVFSYTDVCRCPFRETEVRPGLR